LIDGDEIVLDVGTDSVRVGAELVVYRTVQVRHPVTKKVLKDRFIIGAVRVVQPSQTLTIVKVVAPPSHPIALGDTVQERVDETKPSLNAQSAKPSETAAVAHGEPSKAAVCPAAAAGRDIDELVNVWQATQGRPPLQRVAIYRAFLQRYPDTIYRSSVQQEIAFLENLEKNWQTRASELAHQDTTIRVANGVHMQSWNRAKQGEPVELAAVISRSAPLRSLILHVRKKGESSYQSLEMKRDQSRHATVTVPGHLIDGAGVEYFIEAITTDGKAVDVYARSSLPSLVEVEPAPEAKEFGHRLCVKFTSEIVSFDGFSGRDWYFANQGDFLYRLNHPTLGAVRMGYGDYRGQGGTVKALDELKAKPERAGFTFGFFETEVLISRFFAVIPRVTVGLGRPDRPNDEREGLRGGFQLRLRIGAEGTTHLLLAGEIIPEIGQSASIGLAWFVITKMPMSAEVQVTDEPVNSDELAVRLIYEIGFMLGDQVTLAARLSYQGRTINHSGPGAGVAATFDW
jgi:hypothetical protein